MRACLRVLLACVATGCSSAAPGSFFGADADGGLESGAVEAGVVSLTLSSDALDFGLADCGGQAPPAQVVTLTNAGASAVSFVVEIDDRVAFAVDGAPGGTLAPGASRDVSVVAQPTSASTAPAAARRATLSVRSDDGVVRARASLAVTARGGAIVAPAQLGFGTLAVGESVELGVSVTNVGNAPLTVSLGASPDPDFAARWDGYPQPVVLAPGASLDGATIRFSPAAVGSPDVPMPVLLQGTVCGGVTSPIELVAHAIAPPIDGGADASPDASPEAQADASRDAASPDAGAPDATSDAAADASASPDGAPLDAPPG